MAIPASSQHVPPAPSPAIPGKPGSSKKFIILRALCSGAMRFFEQGGATMDMGTPRQVVLEYRDGAVIIIRVTPDEFLAIITDTTAGLGHLSFTLAKTSSRVAAVI